MSSRADLLGQQRSWAASVGLQADSRGYLPSVDENLVRPLNTSSRLAFENGSGSELLDIGSRPAKMRALHSSSALAVNVFDSWVNQDCSQLQAALGIGDGIVSISFEKQYPTGLPGNPPNLDLALELATDHVIGIESKYSEWLTPKPASKTPFKPKYFPDGVGVWTARGLPRCQELAVAIAEGSIAFRYLDAPQLLKHALGMATKLNKRFSLYYLYYDWPGAESDTHECELNQFSESVGSELRFKAISYQELFEAFKAGGGVDSVYLEYLGTRYFFDSV